MKKILITGVSGYLGPYLCRELNTASRGGLKITGVFSSHKPLIDGIELIKCDLSKHDELTSVFEKTDPDIVYHLASVTPTRITTEEESYIEYFNKQVTSQIAGLCGKTGALMIYTSTDLVYADGIDIDESTSPLDPLTIYAKTKLMGEDEVRANAEKYIILRTALVYGFTLSAYTSFFDVVYKTLKSGGVVNAFEDQYRNPIYTEDAARILAEIPDKYRQNEIINLCGSEYLSRYQMCLMMAEEFGFDKELIQKTTCSEFTAYPMVKRLGLKDTKLKEYGLTTGKFLDNLKLARKIIT
jgi:dTDP-4-dehydrorhamnose reductase